jgi:hypothetical protein
LKAILRVSEPLRLQLHPPAAAGDNYELSLATADGSPPLRISCTLAEQPTLYPTERSLFQGPPANALESDCRISIQAPALETAPGVRFLRTAGVQLPEALAKRVREVPVKVTLTCELVETPFKTEV